MPLNKKIVHRVTVKAVLKETPPIDASVDPTNILLSGNNPDCQYVYTIQMSYRNLLTVTVVNPHSLSYTV